MNIRMSTRVWCGAVVLFVVVAASRAAHSQLAAVDVYGTELLDASSIRADFGAELTAIVDARIEGDFNEAQEIERELVSELEQRGEFATVEFSLIRYFQRDVPYYLTIDVVEQEDADRRLPFREPPQGQFDDPGGLLGLWAEYEEDFRALIGSGALKTGPCEVFHCLAAFGANPDLQPYLAKFDTGVREHEDALYQVALSDRIEQRRARAIFLLAHSDDADQLLDLLGRAIYDSSSTVRNNAIRVLAEMARENPDRPYPTEALIAAMDFPTATDRNKAAWAVVQLAGSSRHRAEIESLAVPHALQMLKLEQPNNHDPAYELVKALSGHDYGPRNYKAWESWYADR